MAPSSSSSPISDEEDRALEEAVAKITAGPDGTLSVEVTPDVGVSEMDQGGEAGMGEEEAGAGMAPVDATDPAVAPRLIRLLPAAGLMVWTRMPTLPPSRCLISRPVAVQ
jgi:hypothetical protein